MITAQNWLYFFNCTCPTPLTHCFRFGLCISFIGSGLTHWKPLWLLHSCVIRCIAMDCWEWTNQLKTPLVKCYGIVALVPYQGNEINKLFPRYGHLSIVGHVGGTHNMFINLNCVFADQDSLCKISKPVRMPEQGSSGIKWSSYSKIQSCRKCRRSPVSYAEF
jgi:hypothetical protein